MNQSGNKRFQETECRIKHALTELLTAKGFHEITVQDICIKAGISRPSFYAHYEDINDMMMRMEQEKGAQIQKLLISRERLTVDSFESYFAFLQENKVFYLAYLATTQNGNVANRLMERFIDVQGKPETDEVRYAMVFFMAGIRATAYRWLAHDCRTPMHVLAQMAYAQYQSLMDERHSSS